MKSQRSRVSRGGLLEVLVGEMVEESGWHGSESYACIAEIDG